MHAELREARRKELLFGDENFTPKASRLEAAQRVQSKHSVEGDAVATTAYFVSAFRNTTDADQARWREAKPSRSLAMWAWSLLRRSEQRTIETLDTRSNLAVSTCMDLMRRLVKTGRTRGARQYLHEVIDDLMQRGQFATVDAILVSADPLQDDPRILVTLLTATKPAKDRLRMRGDFFERTSDALKQRKADEPGLLTGLD